MILFIQSEISLVREPDTELHSFSSATGGLLSFSLKSKMLLEEVVSAMLTQITLAQCYFKTLHL